MDTTSDSCACREALHHGFKAVDDTVGGVESDRILAGSELVVRSVEKWMSLYRCRICGSLWVEACFTSGHMEFYYLFPAPATDDPVRWLLEEAEELPPHQAG